MKRELATLVAMSAFLFSLSASAAAPSGPTRHASAQGPGIEPVIVTGSRIPRLAEQGPAPVTTITAEDIRNSGYAKVADVMSGLTQNLGALENNEATGRRDPAAPVAYSRGAAAGKEWLMTPRSRVHFCSFAVDRRVASCL